MSGPYPLATLACTIDSTGISAPSYADILASLQASYSGIYGSDVVLTDDTQDGQWLAVLAAAFNDCNNATIAAFNAYSPATAQGAGLSSAVKINGLAREIATNSTADVDIVGQAGTIITSGIVGDGTYQWTLPATVTIPDSGTITVTATCATQGAISVAGGAIDQIITPTRGWQSASNPAASTPGAAVETDAALRQRQAVSTSLPAQTPMESIVANVRNVVGVTACQPYENDSATTDGNGIPAYSIAFVVQGGDDEAIATAIQEKKPPGTPTYGTTSEIIVDQSGVPVTINFFRPTVLRIIVDIVLTPLTGYVSTTGAAVQAALAAWVNGLEIGDPAGVAINDLVAAAKLPAPLGETYKIGYGALTAALYGDSPAAADIALAFNQQAGLQTSDINLSVS